MASPCAASSRLALPTVFRSLFRSETPRSARIPQALCQARLFSSTIPSRQIQEQLQNATTEPQKTSSSKPPQASKSINTPRLASEFQGPSTDSAKSSKKNHDSKQKNKDRKDRKDRKPFKNSDKDNRLDKAKQVLPKKKTPEPWKTQKSALDKKFPTGWNPPKKLSPDALDGIRSLHASAPDKFTTSVLAEEFKISPESIRRILKSKWRPKAEEIESRRTRWEARHERIWGHMAELGLRPMTKSAVSSSDSKMLYRKDVEDVEDHENKGSKE
ncbi:required for respiratory growth protein 9 mitochondrial [Penicillium verhagenii]|uniref:required for respiratory growth protein 9 mitochondrial n=1 Tax=Penicillium verhagenii TaxID=1562060 RepID=UPI002545427F|nr:required for respiratory growth protein 9 mitochondrial [Penicillium verhagenii]KAJ5923892.1 required for respiratory growth protein 9 mitochondrial [Penicillium verhagenii]